MVKKKKSNNGSKICMICKRCFASGKAIGGHMKSHLIKLPIPPKPASITQTVAHVPSETSKVDVDACSSSTEQHSISFSSPKIHRLMKVPAKRKFHSMNQDSPARVSNAIDDQLGGESDQSYMTGKRSKRRRKIGDATKAFMFLLKAKVNADNSKQKGSIFDSCFPAIHAALTLMLLSKDKWPEGKELMINKKQKVNKDANEQEVHSHGRRFPCEMCRKVFGSHHALGGHKASHKKFIKNDQLEVDGEFDEGNGSDDNRRNDNDDVLEDPKKVLKCLHCSKVFGSSQGLGRHKKIHCPNPAKFGANGIDLNSPAPMEDIIEENNQDH